ncbi:hypothetical protein BT93_E1988 [Corymbia citriodora subsp. variegata]|nr:hypothetical protein BT93_E1988 [Corymbia citriodora subsp. variegata]
MVNWEELPQELLELIARRLAIDDFLAFRAVCTSWRSAAAKETYSAKSKAPWLMAHACDQIIEFCSPSEGRTYRLKSPRTQARSDQIIEFCSPSGGRTYEVKSPGTQARTFSPPGWILVSSPDGEYRIFNPLSRVIIKLLTLERRRHKPPLCVQLDRELRHKSDRPRIDRIALSSSPSSRRYAVMVTMNWDSGHRCLAFHRSRQEAWTVVSEPVFWPSVLQLIHYDGLFVALDEQNHIMTLNEKERRMEPRLALGQNVEGRPYLVECSGSLLVAWKMRDEVDRFRVFEVDLEKGTQEEVKSLGNTSLFLNDYSSYSSFSMEFDATSCLPGLKPNHVYFTDYANYRIEKKTRSYNMDNGKVETTSDPRHHGSQWFQFDF